MSPIAVHSKRHAFTLAELLVSIAVLTLLVVLVARVLSSATTLIERSRKGGMADAEARLIFDRMAIDLARMVRRSDVDFYGKDSSASLSMNDNDQIAFYTEVPGYYTSPSPTATPTRNARNPVSLVAYRVSNDISTRPQLVRLAKGLVWETVAGKPWLGLDHLPLQIISRWPDILTSSSSSSFTGMADADYEVISESVVRFEYSYVLQPTRVAAATPSTIPHAPSHTTAAFYNDVAAILVTIALVDPGSREVITDYSKLVSKDVFPDADLTNIAAAWNAAVTQPNFAVAANIPKSAASAVHIFQRRFSFKSAQQ